MYKVTENDVNPILRTFVHVCNVTLTPFGWITLKL